MAELPFVSALPFSTLIVEDFCILGQIRCPLLFTNPEFGSLAWRQAAVFSARPSSFFCHAMWISCSASKIFSIAAVVVPVVSLARFEQGLLV